MDDWEYLTLTIKYWKKMYWNKFKYEKDWYNKRYFFDKYVEAGFNTKKLKIWDKDWYCSLPTDDDVKLKKEQLLSLKNLVNKGKWKSWQKTEKSTRKTSKDSKSIEK